MSIKRLVRNVLYKITGSKRFLGIPPKFVYLSKQEMSTKDFLFLDIGCGNHSATNTKKIFPNCRYFGLDLTKDYYNDENDFALMEDFYEVDLEHADFGKLPDNKFDYINLSHVIEHIKNHENMLVNLLPKLKQHGIIYIEYPSYRSTRLPSMHQSLNFFDDPTHVYLHSNRDLANTMMEKDMQIVKMGTRRDLLEILFIPVNLLKSLVKGERVKGVVFWSLFGFADYIIAKKK